MNPYEDTAPGQDQVEDLLRAYADARLAPSSPVLARMRTAVMSQAIANRAAELERQAAASRTSRLRWAIPSLHAPRRAVAFGLAATLTLGTGVAVLAAPPGSALYDARVTVESALFPNTDDARLAAHEARLVQDLADAQAAADRGDTTALEVALAAYQSEVDWAVADVGTDPNLWLHLEDVLGKHVTVLEALAARLPAETAIEHAIETSQNAVSGLQDRGDGSGSGSGPKETHPPHPSHPANGNGNDPNETTAP